jgi:hypothetical protein
VIYSILTDLLLFGFGVCTGVALLAFVRIGQDYQHRRKLKEIADQEAWEEWKETR